LATVGHVKRWNCATLIQESRVPNPKRILVISVFSAAAALVLAVAVARAAETLVVHEWGTFTSFQDPDGVTIPGINVDDEPVPPFVHRLSGFPILTAGSYPAAWSQGAPRCHRSTGISGHSVRVDTEQLEMD
jgi:hypothetical protein